MRYLALLGVIARNNFEMKKIYIRRGGTIHHIPYDTIRYDIAVKIYDTIRYDTLFYDTIRYDTTIRIVRNGEYRIVSYRILRYFNS